MPRAKSERMYNTNLASEYLMMSLLNRAGMDAYLSLGNKKGVDIIVMTKKQAYTIIEVKGVNKKSNDWIIGNSGKLPVADNLFYALFSFESKIEELTAPANFWLIPAIVFGKDYKIAKNQKTIYLSHKNIRDNYDTYKNNFLTLEEYIKMN